MTKSKPGFILRVDPTLQRFLTERRKGREPWSAVLRRELGLKPRRGKPDFKLLYALPSDLFESAEEARGEAVLRSVSGRAPKIERPKKLKEIP
jgi:hypothetical protein